MAIEAGSSVYWQAKRGTVQSGLVGHWDSMAMSSRTGNILYDLVGNNNGTLTNGVTFERIGMGFDGTNDKVSTSFTLPSGNHTIAFWVYKKSTTSTLGGIIAQRNASTARFQVWIRGDGDSDPLKVRYFNGTTSYASTGNVVAANTRWQHLAVSLQGSTLSFFIDGVLDSQQNATDGTAIANGVDIGGNDTGGFAQCQLDDVRIYSRALSQSEITQNFNATRYRFGV